MGKNFRSLFATSFGAGVVHASEHGITKVELPDMSQITSEVRNFAIKCEPSNSTEYASDLLQRYFLGYQIDFTDIPVDLSGIPPFRCKALYVIRKVRYGEIRSYGQIAEQCGSPHAARAVGGAMASNPVPVIIPCHRIIGSFGRMTGFSAPGGEKMKMMLLKMEGVEFKGLIAIKKVGYEQENLA